jgi:hypothetical protein
MIRYPSDPFVAEFLGKERRMAHPEWLTVAEVMEPAPPVIKAAALVAEIGPGFEVGIVVDGNRVLGVVRWPVLAHAPSSQAIAALAEPVPVLPADTGLPEALEAALASPAPLFVVTTGASVAGVLSRTRLASILAALVARSRGDAA